MRFQFQDADGFNLFYDKRIVRLVAVRKDFAQRDQRDHIAPIDALRLPVENVFRLIAHDISPRFAATLPINQRATATQSENFTGDTLAKREQRRAHQIHVIGKNTQSTANTRMTVRQFDFGITPKEQTQKAIAGAARGIEETGAGFVAEIFVVGLRI